MLNNYFNVILPVIFYLITSIAQTNFFFFDLLAFYNFLIPENYKLFFLQNYDIIFANSLNITTLLLTLIVSLLLIGFLLLQANLLNLSFYPNATFDSEKYSPYECGFAPFWTERAQFDIKFYLVALLFLVFDVELMFLLPYCVSYFYLGFHGYVIFLLFFTILIVGFLVEWAVGVLVWKGQDNSLVQKKLIEKKNHDDLQKKIYRKYTHEYLLVLELKYLRREIKFRSHIASSYLVWKIQFRWPYTERYFNDEQHIKLDTELNTKGRLVFYGLEDRFFGSATFSFYELFVHMEKRAIQQRIERFFIWIYGERYKKWLETLTPYERDFAF